MLVVTALGMFALALYGALAGRGGALPPVPLAVVGAAFLAAAAMLGHLTVRDEGEALSVRFGPLPLFGTRIPYEAIESVETRPIGLLHGFGVHGLPGVFIVFSIWGFDAVRIRLKRRRGLFMAKRVIIGTDDAERLAAFLRERAGGNAAER
jgi:hypothetical protein